MDEDGWKENAVIDEGVQENIPPNLPSLVPKADLLREPRCSTDTLRSLDITHNIPRVFGLAMDAEDSPWGGKLSYLKFTGQKSD